MYFMINKENYRVQRIKNSKYSDEYALYRGKKCVAVFYQDGRTLKDAVESVVVFLDMSKTLQF